MGKLVPLTMVSGDIIEVSEYKRDRIVQYAQVFSEYPEVIRVYLFGSALEERCTQKSDVDLCTVLVDGSIDAEDDFIERLWDKRPWTTYDDILACDEYRLQHEAMGALREVKEKGVLIYDKSW